MTGQSVTTIDVFLWLIENRGATKFSETVSQSGNSAIQGVGKKLETFLKSACVSTSIDLGLGDEPLSWGGSANNPPDLMFSGGEAWEIKKISVTSNELQLNSSLPKRTLEARSSRLTQACRLCENWDIKPLTYVVGRCMEDDLHSLFWCAGDVLCASNELYEACEKMVKTGIRESGYMSNETNELGRINGVDSLNRASLRIRGMWTLKSPFVALKEVVGSVDSGEGVVCLRSEVFDEWTKLGRSLSSQVHITRTTAPDPDNHVKQIEVTILRGTLC